jgi:hypothetical protein
VSEIRKFHQLPESDPSIVAWHMMKAAGTLDDVARTLADIDERLAKIEKFQADQRAAKAASDELRKTQP